MIETKKGYICIIERDKIFKGESPKDILVEMFYILKEKGYYFVILDGKKLLKLTNELNKNDIQMCFSGSINDYDNEKWVFALKKIEDFTVTFNECEYLDCFLDHGIAIFSQYDTDGIEFQIHKKCKSLCEELLSIFYDLHIKEGY
jgi:hypothetical protein